MSEEIIVEETHHLKDLYFTVVAKVFEYRVEFKIYDIEGWGEGGTEVVYDKPLWHKLNSPHYPDFVDSLEEADVYLHGTIKWDGCSDWQFDEQEKGCLHGCTRKDIQRFGDVMGYCWDWASEVCPSWCD